MTNYRQAAQRQAQKALGDLSLFGAPYSGPEPVAQQTREAGIAVAAVAGMLAVAMFLQKVYKRR